MMSRANSIKFETSVVGIVLLTAAAAGQTTRVSVDSSGAQANDSSFVSSLSTDGHVVAFTSRADNLVGGDTNGISDIFVHDRGTGITERVSVDSSGAQADSHSDSASLSADGQVVIFESFADNLVGGDTNGLDIFVHDRGTGITERVNVDSSGAQADGASFLSSLSADGHVVAFTSYAENLVAGDTNGSTDIFVHDRGTGITERVSVDSSGAQANDASFVSSLSADGQVVAFYSYARNLVGGDTNWWADVFVHDRPTGITERVSVDSLGAQANGDNYSPWLSADGQIVAFESRADNLVAGDTNAALDVFVHDRATRITDRVSVNSSGAQANYRSFAPSLSVDGHVVAFESSADNLVAGDTNVVDDIFVHDRGTGTTERVSVDTSGAEANCSSGCVSLSTDGQVVAYHSCADDLVSGDTNAAHDIFVHERCEVDAAWSNYGAGFPGTLGVPSFTSRADPRFGTEVILDLENSLGSYTVALFLLGFQRASIPTSWGGDLLVQPTFSALLALGPAGTTIAAELPYYPGLCGFEIDAQALELDAGAARGVSFTPGLELILGS